MCEPNVQDDLRRDFRTKVQYPFSAACDSHVILQPSLTDIVNKGEGANEVRLPGAVRADHNIDWSQRQLLYRSNALEAPNSDVVKRIGGHVRVSNHHNNRYRRQQIRRAFFASFPLATSFYLAYSKLARLDSISGVPLGIEVPYLDGDRCS